MKSLIFFLSLLLLVSCRGNDSFVVHTEPQESVVNIDIISHRGINATDNSLEGFVNAINLGFDGIESDLRMRGEDVILSHDIPSAGIEYDTLEDLLLLAGNSGITVWLETKEDAVVKPMVEILKRHPSVSYILTSFHKRHIDRFKSLLPGAITGLIVQYPEDIDKAETDWIILSKNLIPIISDKKIAVWTIKDQDEYDNYKYFVDAVVSDVQIDRYFLQE